MTFLCGNKLFYLSLSLHQYPEPFFLYDFFHAQSQCPLKTLSEIIFVFSIVLMMKMLPA